MKRKKKQSIPLENITMILGVIALAILIINQVQIFGISGSLIGGSTGSTDMIPKGVPNIYGSELGVSFDDVSATTPQKADETIRKMAALDTTIELAGTDLERYISIVSEISCEYCCGANSIIFPDGKPACGCAHSYAMRGLAKYLITEHGNEYTDEAILEELGKWKTVYFPTQMQAKAGVLAEQGIELNYINIASNVYRGIEAGVSGGMVGGC